MREIKFRAWWMDREYNVETLAHWHTSQGYILRKVTEHPRATNRGYVREQRLVMEEHLNRFLGDHEFIHHVDGNRSNNDLSNLKLYDGQSTHAQGHAKGKRNANGRFVASEPIFEQLKFRFLNTNSGTTEIYTLSELIGRTYRRGQFKYRGRWTGLFDRSGKEIYEGDIITATTLPWPAQVVYFDDRAMFGWEKKRRDGQGGTFGSFEGEMNEASKPHTGTYDHIEVIGNIYENPDLAHQQTLTPT